MYSFQKRIYLAVQLVGKSQILTSILLYIHLSIYNLLSEYDATVCRSARQHGIMTQYPVLVWPRTPGVSRQTHPGSGEAKSCLAWGRWVTGLAVISSGACLRVMVIYDL